MGSKNVRGLVVSVSTSIALATALAIAAGPAAGSDGGGPRLAAKLAPVNPDAVHRPGRPITVTGRMFELAGDDDTTGTGVPATFSLRAVDADGDALATFGPFTAGPDGSVEVTVPGSATRGVNPDASTGYREVVALQLVDAVHESTSAPDGTTAGSVPVLAAPTGPVLENSFVSSVGWVKPGDSYPFTLRIKNFGATPLVDAVVTLTAPDSTTVTDPDGPGGAVTIAGDTLTWNAGTVPGISGTDPGAASLVVDATADSLAQDPRIAWKDLSTDASLTYTGAGAPITARSHGPKVIPPEGGFDTARYGDRPFPVVPVDFFDRAHDAAASAASTLDTKINDPTNAGSTFNLYQEMSYGQLFPHGTVPSDGVATADWNYGPGFDFTNADIEDPNTCHGITNNDLPGDTYQTLQPERIHEGWYQLPGWTDYYGDDANGSALIGAETGIGALQAIDSGCGPTGKSVYDAAQIADPEIDYNEYDTDKDGVVDFFMIIFPGLGGNGDSQINGVPPYDNIWPHSADLRGNYVDEATGLSGYISDDQLTNLEGEPLWYTDNSYTATTTTNTGDALKAYVRVGPYNVNPESAIAHASVISHEYGHSLGLPDYYSTGSRSTYGGWNLMATDHSQNTDVIGKKELGWVIPRVLEPGANVDAANWRDTKVNTHRIDWQQPDGTPYTLQGPNVNNGQGYEAALPGRRIIDPALVPSGARLWFSGAGNDFGCVPTGAHNVDLSLPQLQDVPPGTPVTLTFKSYFDIEWDYDYGFVMATTDTGRNYTSLPSANGYTTPASQNPNASTCLSKFDNGLTGSGASFDAGTAPVDRVLGNYGEPTFVDDQYDLSAYAGQPTVVRFSYATDPGLARPGWFIDDLKVTAGNDVIYASDFENDNDPALVNGGCGENGLQTAPICTDGWAHVTADEASPAEHAYLLEMRDRSGFDAHGRGEDDRDPPIEWDPGVLLTYTDENHGYGNVGTADPPAQSPLDSQPAPEDETPDLDDAAFTAANGDSTFSDSGTGHVDNYTDASRDDGLWRFDFNCLSFDVSRLVGTNVGPETFPLTYNLNGDVNFRMGSGCARFNYGTSGSPPNGGPTAVAQAKLTTVEVGETVNLDGSASFDDLDAPENLGFAWEFGDGQQGSGRQTRHAFSATGTYDVKLTVTDSTGLTDTDTVRIEVTKSTTKSCKKLGATILGTPGNDTLRGGGKRDVIVGLGGRDRLFGRGGKDVICGKGGNDKKISGGPKNDKINGGGGNDRAGGGPGRDRVRGGTGKDRLDGGGGADTVLGGPGTDKCAGDETVDRIGSCERAQ